MPSTINLFDDPKVVAGNEDWYADQGMRADRLEKKLLGLLLANFPQAKTVLDVGCGTGHFTRWMAELGLRAVGLDISKRSYSR